MTLALTISQLSEALKSGESVEELFDRYATLESDQQKEKFVLAILGELVVATRRLELNKSQ